MHGADVTRFNRVIKKAIDGKKIEDIDFLLKTTDISEDTYREIFYHVWHKGQSWMYRKIIEESNFTHWLKKNKQKLRKAHEREPEYNDGDIWFDNILLHVVFTGNPSIVKLFIDNGFNVNAKFNHGINQSIERKKMTYFVNALTWAENLGYNEIAEMLVNAGATREPLSKSNTLIFAALMPTTHYTLQIVHRLCENGHSAEILGHWNSNWTLRGDRLNDAITRAFWTKQYHVVKYMLLRGAGPKPIIDHWLFVTDEDWKRIVFLLLTANATVNWEYYLIRILEDSRYSMELLDVVSQASWHPCLRSLIENSLVLHGDPCKALPPEILHNPHYCSPKQLQTFCRLKLRSHFRNYLYLRFFRKVQKEIPPSVYSYLNMNDLLEMLFTMNEIKMFDNESKAANLYFV